MQNPPVTGPAAAWLPAPSEVSSDGMSGVDSESLVVIAKPVIGRRRIPFQELLCPSQPLFPAMALFYRSQCLECPEILMELTGHSFLKATDFF